MQVTKARPTMVMTFLRSIAKALRLPLRRADSISVPPLLWHLLLSELSGRSLDFAVKDEALFFGRSRLLLLLCLGLLARHRRLVDSRLVLKAVVMLLRKLGRAMHDLSCVRVHLVRLH